MPPEDNLDIQVARYWSDGDLKVGTQWRGTPIELGGRGRLVRIWSVNYYVEQISDDPTELSMWLNAMSSNPEHQGDLVRASAEFFMDRALYATSVMFNRINKAATGGASRMMWTQQIRVYGLIRPRRQIWVLWTLGMATWFMYGIEIYYSEIPMPQQDVITANRKYGKYRRS